uniref:G-protein coupled receptors family 3 profile domain-containing protein n=1 Tax=Xenopus tropicalis TaxID=8364 RepID=A0A803K162_XENTR
MISSDDETHQKASEEMKDEIIKNGICVAFLVQISEIDGTSFYFALQAIRQANASVVIVNSRVVVFLLFLIHLNDLSIKVVWLMLSPLASALEGLYNNEFNGSLAILFHQGNIQGLRDFLYKADPSRFPKDPFTAAVWFQVFGCRSEQAFPKTLFKSYRICNANDTLRQYEHYGYDVNYFRLTYSMYIAVYAVAHALHMDKASGGTIMYSDKTTNGLKPTQIPISRCSASCLPGHRKTFVEGKQVCCYECVQCSEGEISPLPDMENCMKCPEDQWSNASRDKCTMKAIDFLSYKDLLGVALTTTALVLSFCSAAVFCIFLKYKKSPIVKANNQELSYILLLSLMLSFLCSLLFIGRPTKVICLLRQAVFGIIFTICISSILGKTITVIIAFTATRPGSLLRNYVGTRVPKYILLLCTLPEVFICALWLIISPPFPDYDTHSATGKIILQCNEGSPSAFYIMVGYIALLAFVSFFVAYLARKLPDIFNEAQYITFSMLLFCSVWISFILAYVSTTGKYLAAVEIFAILVSSAGLLGLIFVPKCYIISFKTPVSTRAHLI